jgi:hypothetical protein
MKLTEVERERITDNVAKIQSVRTSLEKISKSKIPNRDEIEACLESADDAFREVLGYRQPGTPAPSVKKQKS